MATPPAPRPPLRTGGGSGVGEARGMFPSGAAERGMTQQPALPPPRGSGRGIAYGQQQQQQFARQPRGSARPVPPGMFGGARPGPPRPPPSFVPHHHHPRQQQPPQPGIRPSLPTMNYAQQQQHRPPMMFQQHPRGFATRPPRGTAIVTPQQVRGGVLQHHRPPQAPAAQQQQQQQQRTQPHRTSPRHRQRSHRNANNSINITPVYSEWWDKAQCDQAILDGTAKMGVLRIHNNKFAFVSVQNEMDILIQGIQDRNRAVDGDVVVVQLIPQTDVPQQQQQPPQQPDTLHNAVPDYSLSQSLWLPTVIDVSVPPPQPTTPNEQPPTQRHGRVVAMIAASSAANELVNALRNEAKTHTGFLLPPPDALRNLKKGDALPAGFDFVLFKPQDDRLPHFKLSRTSVPHEFTQDPLGNPSKILYQAQMLDWVVNAQWPNGKFVGTVGQLDSLEVQTSALLIDNDVDHGDFPDDALKELAHEFLADGPGTWRIPPNELASRRDLRGLCICTIDPITAKDIDDALHCVELPDGTFEVGVHIADVSYFVKDGSLLDKEAQRRCTTVYLVNKVLPMLPALLSEELCSLNPGVDRLAFSVIWKMNGDGTMVSNARPWFGRTIIKSASKLHYGLAQQLVDHDPDDVEFDDPKRLPCAPFTKADLTKTCRLLHRLAMARRKARNDPKQGGALVLQAVKMKFNRDDVGNPTKVETYPMYETNQMVEEFMLLANYLVAMRLVESAQDIAVLRCHPPPDVKQVLQMGKMLERGANVHLFSPGDGVSAASLNIALQTLGSSATQLPSHLFVGDKEPTEEEVIAYRRSLVVVASELLKKPMKNAIYFIGSERDRHEFRHWALNIPYYTHFTSPIRRYADVLVHRVLQFVLSNRAQEWANGLVPQHLSDCVARCNLKKEASRTAQEQSDMVFLCALLKQKEKLGEVYETDAIVIDLGPNSFTVLLPELGITKKIHAHWDFESVVADVVRMGVEVGEDQQPPTGGEEHHHMAKSAQNAEDAHPVDVLSLVWPQYGHATVDLRLLVKSRVKLVLKKNSFPPEFICKPGSRWIESLPKKARQHVQTDGGRRQQQQRGGMGVARPGRLPVGGMTSKSTTGVGGGSNPRHKFPKKKKNGNDETTTKSMVDGNGEGHNE